ncbi:hypothetical protein C370_07279 [Cryptococcus neoformans A1-35-8]|nr:hypothetical protein C369_07414 [Cryptococcus neoformans var. grubii A5-35-17]OXH00974.1 hypothetical protein C370_07279 [Cryptococcus neoformans var. grubii A1-35-8]
MTKITQLLACAPLLPALVQGLAIPEGQAGLKRANDKVEYVRNFNAGVEVAHKRDILVRPFSFPARSRSS